MSIDLRSVTGQTDTHICSIPGVGSVHCDIVTPLQVLQKEAGEAGFQLSVASGYRSFERQLAIWNAKACGERAVYDCDGQVIDITGLSDRDKVLAILRWSALPGSSRHHWGTDIDVWDPSAVDSSYQLQLVPEEYQHNGPFARLGNWLDSQIVAGQTQFYRPYAMDHGGVAPELWHLSYRPVAAEFEKLLTPVLLADVLAVSDIELKEVIVANLDEIFLRFIR